MKDATDSGRRPVGRPAIPAQRIIAAALSIVDESGAEALSMRSVAQRLNASTATLYRHFSNRAALVEAVIDTVIGTAVNPVETVEMTWRESCKALAHSMFDALSDHRKVAPLLIGYIPTGPNAAARREACISLLLEARFPPDIAARAYATLAHHILGFAMQLSADSAPGDTDELKSLDAEQYPATTAVARFLPVPLHDEFAFGLDLLIDALSQMQPDPCV